MRMREEKLLEMALGLMSPWRVIGVEFHIKDKRLDI